MQLFSHFLTLQNDAYLDIQLLSREKLFSDKLNTLKNTYQHNYFTKVRDTITNYELKKQILKNIFKTISFGGLIHDLSKYKKTKNKNTYNSFLSKKIKFDQQIEQYLTLCNDSSKEKTTVKKLQTFINTLDKSNTFESDLEQILAVFTQLENTPLHINPNLWFTISSNRIQDFREIELMLYKKIKNSITNDIQTTQNSLIVQIIIISTAIIFLLLVTFFFANSIKNSIKKLEDGINDFFDFLNFKREKPESIKTDSYDEIHEIAESINQQVTYIESSFEEDSDFIHETTQIVTLMKDGNFSERPYFEPNNPNLKELKAVFNELVELISDKIREQTLSLETLNSSLEERVHFQTLELEKQIQEITLAMDKAIAAEIAKDEFLANMSHEIRTPLNAILGFVTILKKQVKDEKYLNYFNFLWNYCKFPTLNFRKI